MLLALAMVIAFNFVSFVYILIRRNFLIELVCVVRDGEGGISLVCECRGCVCALDVNCVCEWVCRLF